MPYDENSIRILTAREVADLDWHKTEELAREHNLPLDWVKRGFEACRRLDIEPSYFVARYITRESDEDRPEFQAVFVEILREQRDDAERGKR